MNKKILLLPIATLLAGCSQTPYGHTLTIISPTQAPSLAFYNYSQDSNFETNNDAPTIAQMMARGQKDVVVLPTNVGVKTMNNPQAASYKIAATITFGNLFVASTGNDDNGVMDDGDYIILFQQNNIPDLIFHSVYGTSVDSNAHYVANANFASQCLLTGLDKTRNDEVVDYVLIAEPALSQVKAQNPSVAIYANLQTLYKEKFSTEIFQASIFVKADADKSVVNSFLSSLEDDIKKGLENPDLVKEGISKASDPQSKYGVAPEGAANAIKNGNKFGLGFKRAKENKQGIDNFLSVFGIDATTEENYF